MFKDTKRHLQALLITVDGVQYKSARDAVKKLHPDTDMTKPFNCVRYLVSKGHSIQQAGNEYK